MPRTRENNSPSELRCCLYKGSAAIIRISPREVDVYGRNLIKNLIKNHCKISIRLTLWGFDKF